MLKKQCKSLESIEIRYESEGENLRDLEKDLAFTVKVVFKNKEDVEKCASVFNNAIFEQRTLEVITE